jgi:hypothetical protein
MRAFSKFSLRSTLAAVAAFASFTAAAGGALADDTIKHPGDHPRYSVEIEPHGLVGWASDIYEGGGFGIGGRFSIPIVENGFIKTINNSVAITFGIDWAHYGACFRTQNCGADYLFFPVAMQWNFYVAQRWSVFGEPGLLLFKGFYGACDGPGCPIQFGPRPAFWLGGRYHFSSNVALTMRIGYPVFSIGVSFM